MKHLFIILIGTGIIFQSFSKIFILINFQINREYISKNLCVQKKVKDNCCKGSCHLKKQLKEEEKKEESPANSLKDIKEFQIFCQNNTFFQFQSDLLLQKSFIPFSNSKIVSVTFSIFHPPTV
jgi:hypothetical protein